MRKFFSHIYEYLRWYVLLGLFISSLLLWVAVFHEDRDGILKFIVLDVGQGDALFIESPSGVQVLVDGGPNNNLMREITKVLPWYDRHIDMLVVTNPDRDHYEGFIPLLKKYKTDVVLEPGTVNTGGSYQVLEKILEDKKVPKVLARRGQIVDLGDGVKLEILFPDRDVSGLSTNDGSIVMKLIYGETSVLLQGDSTAKIEEYLLSLDGEKLKSNILKAGHHGSRTSSSPNYVKKVSPDFVAISSGRENSYGHPHKEVVETLKTLNIKTYDTCNNGRLVFESEGKNFIFKNKNPKDVVVGCK